MTTKTETMKDLTKIYIDLSKCSEEERKHIFSLLPEPEKPDYYEVYNNYKYLQFIPASKFGNDRWMVDKQAFGKQELTYPEFIKLLEGGEGYPGKRYQPLFDHLNSEHGLILHESEMDEIIRIVHELSEGWIKIESEVDLPIHTVWLSNEKDVWQGNLFEFGRFAERINTLATHYQPVIKPEPPNSNQ